MTTEICCVMNYKFNVEYKTTDLRNISWQFPFLTKFLPEGYEMGLPKEIEIFIFLCINVNIIEINSSFLHPVIINVFRLAFHKPDILNTTCSLSKLSWIFNIQP